MITRVWNESCLGRWQRAAHEIYRVKTSGNQDDDDNDDGDDDDNGDDGDTRLRQLYPTFF